MTDIRYLALCLALVGCAKTGSVHHEVDSLGYVHNTLETHRSWIVSYDEQVKVCESAEPCRGLAPDVIIYTNGNSLLELKGDRINTVVYYPKGHADVGMLSCRLWRCWG
jgi:hypothetical protein